MCLILVAWQAHSNFPLVVAANRDEFYARPTAPCERWPNSPEIIGGRDLEAGGTWLGVSEQGRFAAVTNVREPGIAKGSLSRGELTRNFLESRLSPECHLATLDFAAYSGFNLLLSDGNSLYYASNRGPQAQRLAPGVYGLSNHLLDSPWPKLISARERFSLALDKLPASQPFFDILGDDEIVPDDQLPETGVPLEWERRLSAIFVRSQEYGTRASTLVTVNAEKSLFFEERSFGPNGQPLQSSVISTGI
jgi:uncharacterized protein with NRDE domain